MTVIPRGCMIAIVLFASHSVLATGEAAAANLPVDIKPFFDIGMVQKYMTNHGRLGLAVGLGHDPGDMVWVDDISAQFRYVPPHPTTLDDPRLMPTADANNYVVPHNEVYLNLRPRNSGAVSFEFWGFLSIGFKMASLGGTDVIRTEKTQLSGSNCATLEVEGNFHEKEYIEHVVGAPCDDPHLGASLIYYTVNAPRRSLLSRDSFSVPIRLALPLVAIVKKGASEPVFGTLRLIAGAELLRPAKIRLVVDRGWDRYGSIERQTRTDLGFLSERTLYAGIELESQLSSGTFATVQTSYAVRDYNAHLKESPTFHAAENAVLSLSAGVRSRLF